MAGIVTHAGVFAQVGGTSVLLPKARTPVGEWIAAQVAAIDSGSAQECQHCGRYACECEQWHAPAAADPHGDLSSFAYAEIPF